jgi:phosphonate transport system ATP-binding protein
LSTAAPLSAAPPALSARNVAKIFTRGRTRVEVLRGAGFDLHQGEAVALLGANGSGKSTLLRLCLRLIEPDTGEIRLLGDDVRAAPPRALRALRARVGFVFQRHNLVPRLSALSNVLHGALFREGLAALHQATAPSRLRNEALACLERVGLADLAARGAGTLSGGQSQRVAVARALMQRPAVLLADEPAASLDPVAGEEVMALLAELARRDRLAVLFTSHDLEQALRHADRVLGLRGGYMTLAEPARGLAVAELAPLYA